MFGLEILDVVIGLMLVYLLLSLLATAVNEYISSVMNLRGKELARGLGRLLDDLDETDALKTAFAGLGDQATAATARLTEQFYNHPLIRQLATRRGRLFHRIVHAPRLPSYIPARTFAQALLDVLEVRGKDANLDAIAAPSGSAPGAPPPEAEAALRARANLLRVLQILKRETPLDVVEHLGEVKGWLENANLPADTKVRLLDGLTSSQTQLQKLHDSVEVWFNNSMDRVSGAYKRTVQGWLFIIGMVVAAWMNADTIDMWRRLEADDQLRAAMVRRAEAAVAPMDSVVADSAAAAGPHSAAVDSEGALPTNTLRRTLTTTPASQPTDTTETDTTEADTTAAEPGGTATRPEMNDGAGGHPGTVDSAKLEAVARARANYLTARTRLDSMELQLGWTTEQWVQARLLRKNTAGYPRDGKWLRPVVTRLETLFAPRGYHTDLFPFDTGPSWSKLIGLLLTALAISLGAPFWFDLLNKVISIRGAGRSPEERPKAPEGGPKRNAERAPR